MIFFQGSSDYILCKDGHCQFVTKVLNRRIILINLILQKYVEKIQASEKSGEATAENESVVRQNTNCEQQEQAVVMPDTSTTLILNQVQAYS